MVLEGKREQTSSVGSPQTPVSGSDIEGRTCAFRPVRQGYGWAVQQTDGHPATKGDHVKLPDGRVVELTYYHEDLDTWRFAVVRCEMPEQRVEVGQPVYKPTRNVVRQPTTVCPSGLIHGLAFRKDASGKWRVSAPKGAVSGQVGYVGPKLVRLRRALYAGLWSFETP